MTNSKRHARDRARSMLARVMPYEDWIASVDAESRTTLMQQFGDLETFYKRFVQALQREVASPTPRSISFNNDGKVTYTW